MLDINLDSFQQLSAYVSQHSPAESDILYQLRQKTLGEIEFSHMLSSVTSMQFIQLILRLMQAKYVLEIGVYTGYSSLAMAQALPDDGKIIACDHSDIWTKVATPFWEQAGVLHKIDLRLGEALDTLLSLQLEKDLPKFDFIYIDADKVNYQHYLDLGYSLLRQNGLMVFDNTLFVSSGSAIAPNSPTTRAIDAFNKCACVDQRFDISLLGISEGLTLLRKR